MNQFHNILFVSTGFEETEALQHAMRLAADNKATMDILIICPLFYQDFDEYKKSYETFLIEKMHQTIKSARASLPRHKKKPSLKLEVEWGNTPDIRIIQRVLRHSYDLVVKAASNSSAKGFRALDMALLRKCPCTLFLHRPINHNEAIHIAVAIDPKDEEVSGHDLALNLLRLSHALSIHYKGSLSVISCWDFVLEEYLRTNILIDIPPPQIDDMVMEEKSSHYSALFALIREAGIIKDQPTIHHLKGSPTKLIPSSINEKRIDVLVMGTVARTGISGFIIGNTAENILQKINCSLLALKPPGFISPVKAY